MRPRSAEDGVARAAVQHERDLVGHRPGGDEERGLFAQQLRDLGLERGDRGVLAVDVVADLRRRHRLPHLGRRAGDRVGAKIDEAFRLPVHGGRW